MKKEMKRKKRRFAEEQIIGILKQQESGIKTADVCREHNISANTFYVWNTPRGHPVRRDRVPSEWGQEVDPPIGHPV